MSFVSSLLKDIESIGRKLENVSDDVADETVSLWKSQKRALEKQYENWCMRQALTLEAESIVMDGYEELNRTQAAFDDIQLLMITIRDAMKYEFDGDAGQSIHETLFRQSVDIGVYLKDEACQLTKTLRANQIL